MNYGAPRQEKRNRRTKEGGDNAIPLARGGKKKSVLAKAFAPPRPFLFSLSISRFRFPGEERVKPPLLLLLLLRNSSGIV